VEHLQLQVAAVVVVRAAAAAEAVVAVWRHSPVRLALPKSRSRAPVVAVAEAVEVVAVAEHLVAERPQPVEHPQRVEHLQRVEHPQLPAEHLRLQRL